MPFEAAMASQYWVTLPYVSLYIVLLFLGAAEKC